MAGKTFCTWAALLLCGLLVGCGEKNELGRLRVTGSVTLDGKPLDQGTIEFAPTGETGVSGGAMITDGEYEIPGDRGLPPGTYTVRISSADEKSGEAEKLPGESDAMAEERIPAKYNTESEITREVKAEGENKFDFKIE
mgnify:CR=1 FL=1